jgi:hypothetical protein
MTAQVCRETDGTPLFDVPGCAECAVGVPSLFPSQNGTCRGCAVSTGEVCRRSLSRRAAHPVRNLRRSIQIHVCFDCQTAVLSGLDADRAALPVTVTAHALTASGEAWALQSGLATYQLIGRQLYPRDRWNIPGKPPSASRTVLATHDCDLVIPDQHRRPLPPPTPPRPVTTGVGF